MPYVVMLLLAGLNRKAALRKSFSIRGGFPMQVSLYQYITYYKEHLFASMYTFFVDIK